jgi:hypothetical protein
MEADASPLPSDETTPPETKMNFVVLVGLDGPREGGGPSGALIDHFP